MSTDERDQKACVRVFSDIEEIFLKSFTFNHILFANYICLFYNYGITQNFRIKKFLYLKRETNT